MPPKARANVLRGPGRPKRTAAPEPAPVAKTPSAKRGRAARTDLTELTAEPPKKRGRPARATVEEEPVSKTRASRTAKVDAPSTPPKRGRPAKTTLDLNRVVAAPRVSPRISKKTVTSHATAPRIDPRMRARLRARLPPAQQQAPVKEPARQPARRGPGRPRKAPVQAAPTKSIVARSKVAKPAKPLVSRKRRGYTMLEIPDKLLTQMKQTLHDLLHADSSDNVSTREEKEASPVSEQTSDLSAQEQGALDEEHSQDEANLEGHNEFVAEVEHHQEGHLEDEITEETPEPSDDIEVELHMQQIVQVEQVAALNDASSVPDTNQQLAVRDEDSDGLQSRSDSDHDVDGFASEPAGHDMDLYI